VRGGRRRFYHRCVKRERYDIVVVGGGHAGIEAAWAAANLLGCVEDGSPTVALVTLDPAKTGVMSCNPAIGGLAKGQLVREIDAMGGLMGLIADATGIHFKMLNTSKGSAVHGPRCQNDKVEYARVAQRAIASRPEIAVIGGAVETIETERAGDGPGAGRRVTGVGVRTIEGSQIVLEAPAVVLTTGTFMRGLMHTGDDKAVGGRKGEAPASAISGALAGLGFELGRLKTGTPPRLKRSTIDWESLAVHGGDAEPVPFSDMSGKFAAGSISSPVADGGGAERSEAEGVLSSDTRNPLRPAFGGPPPPSATGEGSLGFGELLGRFPVLDQVECRQTCTTEEGHAAIRANLHRAPMFSGQIESRGPRYCPSIEDKVVRFADRDAHGVFLEPESLSTDWVYCNGIASSLPADVQDTVVRTMPGCEHAHIYMHGYAVEYDTVMSHQIRATGETHSIDGLFLAGQINGTSGYEEAAAQGLIAGVNAARLARSEPADFILRRDEAYAGVLMDDLVTKTPVEPYRMFTSRAEHRLRLRADNTADRLTPIADRLGLLGHTELGRARLALHAERSRSIAAMTDAVGRARVDGVPLADAARREGFAVADLKAALPGERADEAVWKAVHADLRYAPYLRRQESEIRRQASMETRRIPAWLDFDSVEGLRNEAREALMRYRPETFGQAGRLEGLTPADLTLLTIHARNGPG
jgi:tRNA uridine 5-carboxymethylaminomethyl modification enzyme